METNDKDELFIIKASLEVALRRISNIIKNNDLENDKGESILAEICRYGKISDMDLCGLTRKSNIIFYRRIACYLLTDYCSWSQDKIANRLDLKSHCTVLFHRNKMRAWMIQPRYAPYEVLTATRNIINNLGL